GSAAAVGEVQFDHVRLCLEQLGTLFCLLAGQVGGGHGHLGRSREGSGWDLRIQSRSTTCLPDGSRSGARAGKKRRAEDGCRSQVPAGPGRLDFHYGEPHMTTAERTDAGKAPVDFWFDPLCPWA